MVNMKKATVLELLAIAFDKTNRLKDRYAAVRELQHRRVTRVQKVKET